MRKSLINCIRRRTEIGKSGTMMAQSETQTYGYNVRDELISGQGFAYNYDAIGNRTIAEGKTYTANNLNQYTAIDSFTPQYDADGNQTLIKTSTGIWSVTYNAENRPVRWECGDTVVTMEFDRMGRRTFYKEMNGNTQVTFTRFVYKDYFCVRQVFSNSPYNTYKNFVWDPTETIATRPLKLQLPTMSLNLFYMHDGNKNVSDVVYRLTSNGVAAHYDYAPFGAVTRSVSNSVPTADITTLNPFRFSSEYHDDTLGLVYYNYRHYNPTDGRWTSRDILGELTDFLICSNNSLNMTDTLGMVAYSPFSFNTLPDKKLTQPFDTPTGTGSGMAGSVSQYGHLDEQNHFYDPTYFIEDIVNTSESTLLSIPCCLPNGKQGIKYEVRPFAATNRISFFVSPECRKYGRKFTTREHENQHTQHARQCFLKSTAILRNLSSECVSKECDSARINVISASLKCARLERDYLDVKLHYDDYLPPFIPTIATLDAHLKAWKEAEVKLLQAQTEMFRCNSKK